MTQASTVIPVVRSSAAASATVTQSSAPSKESAPPKRPLPAHVAPAIAPVRPLPEMSSAEAPEASFMPYAATSPPIGRMLTVRPAPGVSMLKLSSTARVRSVVVPGEEPGPPGVHT